MVHSATARPVRGLRCPDVYGRMLRNLRAWIVSLLTRPLQIGSHAKKTETLSHREDSHAFQCGDRKNRSGICMDGRDCGREKQKPPDGYPRAFACLGDRVTDLRGRGISRGVCRCRAACMHYRNPSTARVRPHRDGSATFRTGWRCGRRVSSEDSVVIHGVPAAVKRSAAAMGAHVTPVFFRLQTFFSQIDERLDE